ncbi:hypothetical protein MIND_00882400 [Mycena indigotica]|uniref:Uncharacterized protein n=1 Tax=Mycena indigotica TaxID=2126181 RepID=A0A8H6SI87_9AGAR|nr:uncharacterized protein MIND_00882400 [Mycena indigotica]KAF7299332.1 hypothetical protein MIND_00882400 [Mycena indigotica]
MAEPILWFLVASNTILLSILASAYLPWVISAYQSTVVIFSTVFTTRALSFIYGGALALCAFYLWNLQAAVQELEDEIEKLKAKKKKPILRPAYGVDGNLVAMVRARGQQQPTSGVTVTRRATIARPSLSTTPAVAPSSSSPTPVSTTIPAPPLASFQRRAASEWNGWPDGPTEYSLSRPELTTPGAFDVFWVLESLPSVRRGSIHSPTLLSGKKFRSKCRGTLICGASRCAYGLRIAPDSTMKGITRQLKQVCLCGHALYHAACGVELSVVVFRGGASLTNHGNHTHGKYSHRLLLPSDGRTTPNLVELTGDDCSSAFPGLWRQLNSTNKLENDESIQTRMQDDPSELEEEEDIVGPQEWDEAEQHELDDDPDADTGDAE